MKGILSTDRRLSFIVFSSNYQEAFHFPDALEGNLNLLPQKHEVNKCTYTWRAVSWPFLQFRGIHSLWYIYIYFFLLFFDFVLYWQYLPRLWDYFSLFWIPSKMFFEAQDWGCTCLCYRKTIGHSASSTRRTLVIFMRFIFCLSLWQRNI